MNKRIVALLLGSGILAAALPGSVSGQGFAVSPWVGLYAPTSRLGTVSAVEFGKKESTFAYGADLDLGGGSGIMGFRIGAGYASNSDVPVTGVGCTTCSTRSTVLTATGGIVLRPLPLPMVRPYAVLGAGARWYDFDFDDPVIDGLLSDKAVFTWQLGAGVTLSSGGPLSFFAEVSDFVNGFEFEDGTSGDTQHDLFFKVGIVLGFGRS